MHPVEALHHCGGAATLRQLLRFSTRDAVERLVASGDIVRDGHGRYSLPAADDAVRAANLLTGVVSHLSAALLWGWEVKSVPDHPHVTLPRNRNISRDARRGIVPHWADLGPDDVDGHVTRRERTLVDCLTTLPFDEGLAVADSALRHSAITADRLGSITAALRGPGSVRAREVARYADGRAANPFESTLRALAREVPGLRFEPQREIATPGFYARPDLVDPGLRLVAEADSYAYHASRRALRHDCHRYTTLVSLGWTVLRYSWEHVMHEPDWVVSTLTAATERAQPPKTARKAG